MYILLDEPLYFRNCSIVVYDLCFDLQDFGDVAPAEDWGNHHDTAERMSFSSDGEDSDAEFVVSPQSDIDLPTITKPTDEALTVSAYRLAMLGQQRKKHRQVCQPQNFMNTSKDTNYVKNKHIDGML